MDSFTVTVLVIFGLIAVVEAAHLLIKIPVSNNNVLGYTIVTVLNSEDDVSLRIDNLLHRLRWTDDEFVRKIILIDYGMTYEQLAICEEYCTENPILEVTKPENTLNLIISTEK